MLINCACIFHSWLLWWSMTNRKWLIQKSNCPSRLFILIRLAIILAFVFVENATGLSDQVYYGASRNPRACQESLPSCSSRASRDSRPTSRLARAATVLEKDYVSEHFFALRMHEHQPCMTAAVSPYRLLHILAGSVVFRFFAGHFFLCNPRRSVLRERSRTPRKTC